MCGGVFLWYFYYKFNAESAGERILKTGQYLVTGKNVASSFLWDTMLWPVDASATNAILVNLNALLNNSCW